MKSSNYFKVVANNIGYVGSNFQEHFYDMEFIIPKMCELKVKKLERSMNDSEILAEFKPQESSLGELAYALENDVCSKDGYANIFYIRGKDNVLWAVSAGWGSDYRGWNVYAGSVEFPRGWYAGRQVVSRDWNFEPKASDPLKLGDSDAVKVTEIEWNGHRYKLTQ